MNLQATLTWNICEALESSSGEMTSIASRGAVDVSRLAMLAVAVEILEEDEDVGGGGGGGTGAEAVIGGGGLSSLSSPGFMLSSYQPHHETNVMDRSVRRFDELLISTKRFLLQRFT